MNLCAPVTYEGKNANKKLIVHSGYDIINKSKTNNSAIIVLMIQFCSRNKTNLFRMVKKQTEISTGRIW